MSDEYVQCPECFGDGEDLEDSSKDCWKCRGSGEVIAAEKPCPCCSAPISAHNELLIQHETMLATLRASLARAEAELARAKPVVEAAVRWSALRFAGIEHMAERQALGAAVDDYLASEPKETT